MSSELQFNEKFFEELVRGNFAFVESEGGMLFKGVRLVDGGDPRDATMTARYASRNLRFDVGWCAYALSLAVVITYEHAGLARNERHVYFEPFVEYLTNGRDEALVPCMARGMIVGREAVLREGLPPVMERLAKKLQAYFAEVTGASIDQIRGYHMWCASKDKSVQGSTGAAKHQKILSLIEMTLPHLQEEMAKAQEGMDAVDCLRSLRFMCVRLEDMASMLRSGVVQKDERYRGSMSHFVVDTWPMNDLLGSKIAEIEYEFYRLK